jgi:hypothetical protein
MKKNSLLSLLTVVSAMLLSLNVHAQRVDSETGQVVWLGERLSTAISESTAGRFVYLVEFKSSLDANNKERYVTQGGRYGVQGSLSSIGMRMQFQNSTNGGGFYQMRTRIQNSNDLTVRVDLGDLLSVPTLNNDESVYLDRSDRIIDNANDWPAGSSWTYLRNYPDWQITETTRSKGSITYVNDTEPTAVTVNTISFHNRNAGNNAGWIGISNGKLVLTTQNNAASFVIITEENYNQAMTQVTWGEVDLGVFVQAGEFSRDNKDLLYWRWGDPIGESGEINVWPDEYQADSYDVSSNQRHWHQRNQNAMCNGTEIPVNGSITKATVGDNIPTGSGTISRENYQSYFADYYAGEIYNEAVSLTQVLDGSSIPNLTDGLYKFSAQALYYDGNTGTTNNGVSFFIIKREMLDDDRNVVSTTFERLPIAPLGATGSRYNITPASGVSAGYVFDTEKNSYMLNYFLEINGKTRLTIGIEQTQAVGWTVIGNIHLFAHGKQALFLNEDWEDRNDYQISYHNNNDREVYTGDPYFQMKYYEDYDYPATVYYQRTLKAGNWTTICMPVSLTGAQVAQAFGDETLVSEFDKVEGTCLKFKKTVDIATNLNEIIIQAGTPYIIKPSKKSPDYTNGKTLEIGNGQNNHTVTIDGNVYAIGGVTKGEGKGWQEEISPGTPYTIITYRENTTEVKKTENGTLTTRVKAPTEVKDAGSGITFVGSFYKKVITQAEINNDRAGKSGEADYYVFSGGDLYHLQGGRDWNIWATYAYLYLPKGSLTDAKDFTMSVDVDGVEEISTVIELDEVVANPVVGSGNVYTLNGLKVGSKGGLNSLQKGIYIKNGKKFIVK